MKHVDTSEGAQGRGMMHDAEEYVQRKQLDQQG